MLLLRQFSDLNKNQNIYFDTIIDTNHTYPNGTEYTRSMAAFNSYILNSMQKIYQTQNVPLEFFSKGSKEESINFIQLNFLGTVPFQSRGLKNKWIEKIQQLLTSLSSILNYILYSITGLIVLLILVSIFIFLRIRSRMVQIFSSYTKIRDHEISNRKKDLGVLERALKQFQENNFFEDLMATQALQDLSGNKIQRSQRNLRHYRINCYFFGLLCPLALLLIFFSLLLLFVFIKSSLDQYTISKALSSMKGIYLSNNIIDRNNVGLLMVLQYCILGKDTFARNKPIQEALNDWVNISKLISTDLETFQNIHYEDLIHSFPSNEDFPDLCLFTPQLKNRTELCKLLDRSIPQAGVLQSSHRILDFINSQIRKIRDDNADPKELLNQEDFIDFQYTFQNVYLPGIDQWTSMMVDTLINNSRLIQDRLSSILTYCLLVNLIVMVLLVFIIDNSIKYQISTIIYGYKLLSVEIVAENPIVKMVFLRFMRLSLKYF